MPTKKIRKNKKRRSYGGKLADALNTAFSAQAAAATNANQQRLSIKDPGILAKRTANEFRYAALESMARGEPLNVSKVGNKLEKKIAGFQTSAQKGIEMAGHAGLPTSGLKSPLSSATTSVSGIVKSASNSFSGMTKSATNGMCIIL